MTIADTETWKAIPGFEGVYEVSDRGQVRRIAPQVRLNSRQGVGILTLYKQQGYRVAYLIPLDGPAIRMMVHCAVSATFIGPKPRGMQVNHKNGDKSDNRLENLEYVTCQENIRHAWEHGLSSADHMRGEGNCNAKLTEQEVRQIRDMAGKASMSKIACRFGVTLQNVSSILKCKTWKHVA